MKKTFTKEKKGHEEEWSYEYNDAVRDALARLHRDIKEKVKENEQTDTAG